MSLKLEVSEFLTAEQQTREAALLRAVLICNEATPTPERTVPGDATDLMILATFILTGTDEMPPRSDS